MKSHFNPKRIEFVRRYVEKHTEVKASVLETIFELCDETEELWKENVLLRENIFTIEQAVAPEKQWENILAAKLARATDGNNLEITNSINSDTWVITIQKKFGKTFLQSLQDSEARRLKAEKKTENLLRENKKIQIKLTKNEVELQVLKSLKNKLNSSPEEILKTRQEIEKAIELVNGYIGQYNTQFYRKEMGKLTNSMKESHYEAWQRAANETFKNNRLEKEKQNLLMALNDKRNRLSKFSKYRKKE
jgi:flagellar hook-basal body complex protein FliE